jgi:hypothetical protein
MHTKTRYRFSHRADGVYYWYARVWQQDGYHIEYEARHVDEFWGRPSQRPIDWGRVDELVRSWAPLVTGISLPPGSLR